jgi:NAD-dependent dihydropyrimidine dehydrogenase PreA subunit
MKQIKYFLINIILTFLRGFPFPCKTGIVKIGNPDKNSPVFLTCNYLLTVERVKRSLKGMNAYLLIAKSNGINVWCASIGGHLTNHDVISILKTSGIEELVNHRKVILPQLSASGIQAKSLKEKTGWKVIWGPVYAKDIPTFVKNNYKKDSKMKEVKFPLIQRIEMALMWSFPFSVIVALLTITFWKKAFFPLTILIWVLPLLIFIFFPICSNFLISKRSNLKFSKYTIIFHFTRFTLILWGSFIFCLTFYSLITDVFSWRFILKWSLFSFFIILIVSIDLMGSTPIYKSGLHEERLLKIHLDEKKCKGAGFCIKVCPRSCYEFDKKNNIARIKRADKCVQCGACIVQCPFDAIYFKSLKGEIIPPEIIRKFKLNLLGKRLVKTK